MTEQKNTRHQETKSLAIEGYFWRNEVSFYGGVDEGVTTGASKRSRHQGGEGVPAAAVCAPVTPLAVQRWRACDGNEIC
jgi:hypothetical protein